MFKKNKNFNESKIQNVFSSTSTTNADKVPRDCNQSFLIDSAVKILGHTPLWRQIQSNRLLFLTFAAAWKFSVKIYFPKKH